MKNVILLTHESHGLPIGTQLVIVARHPETGSVDARLFSDELVPGKLIEGIDIDWFEYAENAEERRAHSRLD